MRYNNIYEVREGIVSRAMEIKVTALKTTIYIVESNVNLFQKTKVNRNVFNELASIMKGLKRLDNFLIANVNLEKIEKDIKVIQKRANQVSKLIDRKELNDVCIVKFISANENIYQPSIYKRPTISEQCPVEYAGSFYQENRKHLCNLYHIEIEEVIAYSKENQVAEYKAFDRLEEFGFLIAPEFSEL